MAPLQKELSSLEVEPLDVMAYALGSERDRKLDELVTVPGNVDVAAILTGNGILPIDEASCCCCCCPACCC